MKTLKTTLLAGLFVAGFATASYAADPIEPAPQPDYSASGFYIRGDLGWSFLEWGGGADDSAPAFGAGIGYQATDNLRTDLRVDWAGSYSVAPGAKMDATTVLGNLYFDIPNETIFTPYVGAGLGWGWVNDAPGGNDNGFAYALMGGAAVDLSDSLALDLGYRFRDIGISGPDTMEHQLTAGLRVKF